METVKESDVSTMRTLSALQQGKTGTVARLQGGRTFTARMAALGFTPGAEIKMIQNFGHGPVIVMVRGSRIALGRGEASKVVVRDEQDHNQ